MSKLQEFKDSMKNLDEFEKTQPDSIDTPKVSDVARQFMKGKSELTINERTYTIKKFNIMDTMDLIPILGKSFLVPISALFKQSVDEGEDGLSGITQGLFMLFENIENGELPKILGVLLENTTVNGKPVELNEDFDDISDVFEVAVKVLEISFKGFFEKLGLKNLADMAQGISSLQQ